MKTRDKVKLAIILVVPAWIIYNFLCFYQLGPFTTPLWRMGYYWPSISFVLGGLARHYLFFEKK